MPNFKTRCNREMFGCFAEQCLGPVDRIRATPLSGGLDSCSIFRADVTPAASRAKQRTSFVAKHLHGRAVRELEVYRGLQLRNSSLAPRRLGMLRESRDEIYVFLEWIPAGSYPSGRRFVLACADHLIGYSGMREHNDSMTEVPLRDAAHGSQNAAPELCVGFPTRATEVGVILRAVPPPDVGMLSLNEGKRESIEKAAIDLGQRVQYSQEAMQIIGSRRRRINARRNALA